MIIFYLWIYFSLPLHPPHPRQRSSKELMPKREKQITQRCHGDNAGLKAHLSGSICLLKPPFVMESGDPANAKRLRLEKMEGPRCDPQTKCVKTRPFSARSF